MGSAADRSQRKRWPRRATCRGYWSLAANAAAGYDTATVGPTTDNPLSTANSMTYNTAMKLYGLSIADGADVESLRRHRNRRCGHRGKPEQSSSRDSGE
jgi:hypothetical protein